MKTVKKIIFICLAALITVSFNCRAGGLGTTGGQILDMHTSARVMAMGNAGVGLSGDPNSLIYNPAGLSKLSGIKVQGTHIFYFLGTYLESLTLGNKINNIGTAAKIKIFTTKDTVRDSNGNEGEDFSVTYYQYSFGFGYHLNKRHSIGAGLNYIAEHIFNDTGHAAGINLGWQYDYSRMREVKSLSISRYGGIRHKECSESESLGTLGAVIKNIGTKIATGGGQGEFLPVQLAVGGWHSIPYIENLLGAWEGYVTKDLDYGIKAGVEGEIEGFKARAGGLYKGGPNVNMCFGFGVPSKNWNIDYAFLLNLDLGMSHRISIGADF